MTRVGDSQTTTQGCARRTSARHVTKHMVKHVHAVERWRQGCTKTLQKGSFDSGEKPASTCVERKHKR